MKNIYSVPPSKSISNRALTMAFLNGGKKTIKNILKSDDTQVMLDLFEKLKVKFEIFNETKVGFDIAVDSENTEADIAKLFMGNAGTATRFMIPALCVTKGTWEVYGDARMHERPISDLVNALKQLGGNIEYLEKDGYLPLKIIGGELVGTAVVKCYISSQYLSGLMITNAFLENPFEIKIDGEVVSGPYIELTKSVIDNFKLNSEFVIEGDASSASYFWALGAIKQPITVNNVPLNTKQADIKFLDALSRMGAQVEGAKVSPGTLKGIEMNCRDFPDSAMTLAVLCAVAEGESRLFGLSNLKFKECDRLRALETELRKIGVQVNAFDDGLEITGNKNLLPAKIETYNDHRIAMCFAVLKTIQPGIEILNPECVSKTYPTFWEEFPLQK